MDFTTEPNVALLRDLAALLRGELCPKGIAWEQVVVLARRHSVSPLLFWQLRRQEAARQFVPAPIWDMLQGDFYAAVVQGTLREQELARVLRALNQVGVTALLLKGAALAWPGVQRCDVV